jgi:mycothiol synthase
MICDGETPVATAIAWGDGGGDASLGMVHYVATDPDYRGRGLGFAVTNAVLHHMKGEGKSAAYLSTDDFRLPAIKIYLKLGFEPDTSKEGHAERWQAVRQKLAGAR